MEKRVIPGPIRSGPNWIPEGRRIRERVQMLPEKQPDRDGEPGSLSAT